MQRGLNNMFNTPEVCVIDSTSALACLLEQLDNLSSTRPALYLDLEGNRLGRYGTISILSLFFKPRNEIFLIDIFALQQSAFTVTSNINNTTTLASILEAEDVPKVIFDVRNDSDALFNLYGVCLGGVIDLQLMELACRGGTAIEYLAGLAKCVDRDLSSLGSAVTKRWKSGKQDGVKLFDPRYGGRRNVFEDRPIKPGIVRYCAHDVAVLPALYDAYQSTLAAPNQAFWRAEVTSATTQRIGLAKDPGYNPHSQDKARGPWHQEYIEQARDSWNEEVLHNALFGDEC